MMVKIAVGTDLAVVENKEISWTKLSGLLTKHKQSNHKDGKYFIGGYFTGTERKEDQMVARTLLTFDVDDTGLTLDDIEYQLWISLKSGLIAYSTYNHTADHPRVRIVIPLSREVTPEEYRHLSKRVGDELQIPLDACSYKPNQVMYTPRCADVRTAWSMSVDGESLVVDDYLTDTQHNNVSTSRYVSTNVGDDLDEAIANQPRDLTDEQVKDYLRAYPAAGLDYQAWVQVGIALHHQYQGSDAGLRLWCEWSKQDTNRYIKGEMAGKWGSFGRSARKITFASVIFHVKNLGGIGAVATTNAAGITPFDELLAQCAAVSDRESHTKMVERISRMQPTVLATTDRAMLASRLHKAWAHSVGIGKVEVRKQLQCTLPKHIGNEPMPGWAQGWVYLEATCEYYHTTKRKAIKREAFNATHASEPECLAAKTSASVLVNENPAFTKVHDTMYWPGGSLIFEHNGNDYVNSCQDDITPPCDELDDDGQAVIDLFLTHTRQLLPNPAEQDMLLDWLAFGLQNPGVLINFAIVLQGAEGCGKSYYSKIMQHIMGSNASQVSTSDIMGRFTGWAAGSRLAIIEEMRISGDNVFAIIGRMKAYIGNTSISIERKGRDSCTVPNFTNYFMLSNHKDAIPIGDGDRRYNVLFCSMQNKAQMEKAWGSPTAKAEHFKKLFNESERRIDALAHYLMNRTISASFDHKGEAPETSAKQQMRTLSVSEGREQVEDAIDRHRCAIINKNIIDITKLVAKVALDDDGLPKTSALSKILTEMGYSKSSKRIRHNLTRRQHTVWFGPEYDEGSALKKVAKFHNSDTDPDDLPF